MKPYSTLATLIIALAAPLTTAAAVPEPAVPEPAVLVLNSTGPPEFADAWCEYSKGWVFHYRVYIKEVENVGKTCEGLWKGIKGHRFLCPLSKKHCGASPDHEKGLKWTFTAGLGCNVGCVQSAFWGATKNKYGALDVSQCQGESP